MVKSAACPLALTLPPSKALPIGIFIHLTVRVSLPKLAFQRFSLHFDSLRELWAWQQQMLEHIIPFNGYSVEGVIQGGTSIATRKHFAHCLSICLLSFLHCREAKMITRVSSIEIHKFGDIEIPASQVTGPHHCKCEATYALEAKLGRPFCPQTLTAALLAAGRVCNAH